MTDRGGASQPAGARQVPDASQAAPAGEAERPSRLPTSRPTAKRPPDRRNQRRWVPAAARWLTLLVGAATVIEGARPAIYNQYRLHRIGDLAPGTLINLTRTADVIIGLLLLMLSHGLRRRKRRASEAVIALLATSVVIHLAHYPQIGGAVITAAMLVVLVVFRREFYAVGDRRTRWRALAAFCWLVVADLAIGLCYITLSRGLQGGYSLMQRAQSVIYGLLGFSGPVQFGDERHTDLFNLMTSALGVFTLIVTVYLFLRPAKPVGRLSPEDAGRIRGLLDKYGKLDSLGYFTLRDDKSIIWSPTGKSCIGYRVLSGVMLAAGDPIGDPEAWPGAIHAFLDEAARHAWVPAVVGCGELGAEVWCREGDLTALELGDEAIVDVAGFSLEGRAMRNVRQMVTRVGKHGYTAEFHRTGDMTRAELDQLVRQADSWRGSPTERGFSMALGRVGGPGDERCVVATAMENGVLRAVLHFVPWGADGLSLDLMRRDRSAQPGVNDFLIVEAIRHAPQLGVKRISLNFAAFRSALERGERIGAGPVLRAWRRVLLFMSRWFQIESLYKFNAKFCPDWVPRFMVFPSTGDTPRIGLAALEAEAFLVRPRLEIRRLALRLGLGRFITRRPLHPAAQPAVQAPVQAPEPGPGDAGPQPAGSPPPAP